MKGAGRGHLKPEVNDWQRYELPRKRVFKMFVLLPPLLMKYLLFQPYPMVCVMSFLLHSVLSQAEDTQSNRSCPLSVLQKTSGHWTARCPVRPPDSHQALGQTLSLCCSQFPHLENAGLNQFPESGSSEDGSPSSATRWPSSRPILKRSTAQSRHRRPSGQVPYWQGRGPARGSLLPARYSWDLSSSSAALQERRLSTVGASGESTGRLEPDLDPWDPGEDPLEPASVTHQRQQRESPPARSRPRKLGLPGIPDTARRQRRDLKKLAAEMERVRQWESRLLQNIEEAVQHELTIDDD
nr:PREDICTED: uncharacterized protein LOC103550433 [Equus przewalskii]